MKKKSRKPLLTVESQRCRSLLKVLSIEGDHVTLVAGNGYSFRMSVGDELTLKWEEPVEEDIYE